jgi:hypothetical protein
MRGSGNGRPAGEEDESDSPGPLDREMRRRRPARKARTKRENVLLQLLQRRCGLAGPARLNSARERGEASETGWAKAEWAAWSAEPKAKKRNF